MESRDQGLRTASRSTAVEIYQAPLLIKFDSMGSAIFCNVAIQERSKNPFNAHDFGKHITSTHQTTMSS